MKNKNELKLMKNMDNIINKYIKIDERLLETIANNDIDSFKEVVSENSSDNFLAGIVDNYETFTNTLFEEIANRNSSQLDRITMAKEEKEQYKEIKAKEKKRKVQPSIQKPGRLKPKKGQRLKWEESETNRIKILVRAGKKPKEIREEINQNRLNNNQRLRTSSSINSKIYSIKKQEAK